MKVWRYKLFLLGSIVGVLLLQACGTTGLYKPSGKGPFPAVIVLHGSSGIRPINHNFAYALSREGYITLVVDYLSAPHGSGPDPDVIKEELQIIVEAYDQIKAQPTVDPDRIGMAGFSRGSNRALIFVDNYSERKIRGIVSYYAGCWGCGGTVYQWGRKFPSYLFLHGDLDRTHPSKLESYCSSRRSAGNILEIEDLQQLWTHSPVLNEVRDLSRQVQVNLDERKDGQYFMFCMGVAETQTGDPLKMYQQAEVNARGIEQHYQLLQIEDSERRANSA